MIKACFFDVDGTLLSHKQERVPESTINSLKELRKRGIKTVICTGRFLDALKELPVMEVPFDGYLTLNGQLCYDENYQMFAGTPIPDEEMEVLISMFNAERIPLLLIGENGSVLNFVNQTVEDTQSATMGTIPEVGQYSGEKIYQICSYVPEAQKAVLRAFLDDCEITSWNETGIDIIAKGSGKDVGLQRYIDKVGLRRSEIMAFGDGENDIPMLKFAGIGVAMGNGGDKVKAAADYVTDSVDDDGIEKALKHFGLIGENNKLMVTKLVEGEKMVLSLEGRLDTSTASDLYNKIGDMLEGITDLTFDFEKLEYISSFGLRVILSAQKILTKQGGVMHIVNANEVVSEVLDITGFSAFIQ